MTINNHDLCPCGSQVAYEQCCYPFHHNHSIASSPEQLMRSRYCAFALGLFDYLISTHKAQYRHDLTAEQLAREPLPRWRGLQILDSQADTTTGTVTFKAWYTISDKLDVIYEKSDFVLEDGRWLYTQGEQFSSPFPGRNDLCICGSNKKFKQCCSQYT